MEVPVDLVLPDNLKDCPGLPRNKWVTKFVTLLNDGGDIVGEAWGKSKERVEIPINNYKDRQTYYGSLNLLEPDLIREKYLTGNGENTVKFVENLQKKMSGKDC